MHPCDFSKALSESDWLNRMHGNRQFCTRCDGLQRTTSRAEPCSRCGGTGYEPVAAAAKPSGEES